jgi:hypothetical protein
MTNGLSGRMMTYDAENRPLSVTLTGKTVDFHPELSRFFHREVSHL